MASGSCVYRLGLPREDYRYESGKVVMLGTYEGGPSYNGYVNVIGRERTIKALVKALRKAGMEHMSVQRGTYKWKDK